MASAAIWHPAQRRSFDPRAGTDKKVMETAKEVPLSAGTRLKVARCGASEGYRAASTLADNVGEDSSACVVLMVVASPMALPRIEEGKISESTSHVIGPTAKGRLEDALISRQPAGAQRSTEEAQLSPAGPKVGISCSHRRAHGRPCTPQSHKRRLASRASHPADRWPPAASENAMRTVRGLGQQ